MEELIRKYALENAIKFNGKANPGAVIGKLIQEDPKVKQNMKEISIKINQIIKDINNMPLEKQKEEFLKLDPNYYKEEKEKKKQRQKERKELPELKNAVEGKVITRIAPEPSKYNHLGHAVSFLLNYMYAQKYKGKCILRFEDTNPERSTQEYADAMREDVLDYLDIKTDKTVFVSDHMEKFVEFAEELIRKGNAYTCSCPSEQISKHRRDMIDCPCREKSKKIIEKEWQDMKSGKVKEGSLTLRLKISMQHKNAVMRDPVIFRLSYAPHYRQKSKYKVWPMYDFENAVEEGLMKVTHVLRSNEFESRIELQNYIRQLFNLPDPVIRQYARFNVTGAITQGREIREMIESGNYMGWDDPRLVTLRALRRRGIVKEAFYELSKVIGMSKANSNLDFSVIASINRKLLDEKAHRFFFIPDPKKVIIKNAPEQDIELDLHPHNEKGGRRFKVKDSFYISKEDFDNVGEGELFRLMDCMNCTKKGGKLEFDSLDLETYKQKGKKIIHWLTADDNIEVEVLMPDAKVKKGLAEKSITKIKIGDVIQFERFGFCRLDSKNKFWYTHD
ncbi:MAG: glutamate--tRNA ligase [Nanoarchaeota archaeon]|nr:glutamate--tRNA ligase [Nanoarchaeota archaeon]MBU1703826.1 glutamate--tRNA ligase [Nanoarchaeota archaeon]